MSTDGLGFYYPAGVTGEEWVFQNYPERLCRNCLAMMDFNDTIERWVCSECGCEEENEYE